MKCSVAKFCTADSQGEVRGAVKPGVNGVNGVDGVDGVGLANHNSDNNGEETGNNGVAVGDTGSLDNKADNSDISESIRTDFINSFESDDDDNTDSRGQSTTPLDSFKEKSFASNGGKDKSWASSLGKDKSWASSLGKDKSWDSSRGRNKSKDSNLDKSWASSTENDKSLTMSEGKSRVLLTKNEEMLNSINLNEDLNVLDDSELNKRKEMMEVSFEFFNPLLLYKYNIYISYNIYLN